MFFEIIVTICLIVLLGVREFLHDRSSQRLNKLVEESNKNLASVMEKARSDIQLYKDALAKKDQIIIDLQRQPAGEANNLGADEVESLLENFNIEKVKEVVIDGQKRDITIYG